MKRFQRSIASNVVTLLGAVGVLFMVMFLFQIVSDNKTEAVECLVATLIFLILLFFALIVLPEDFEYNVKPTEDMLVFEFSEEDHRKIAKTFSINKDHRYLILDDGEARISIAYNRKVMKFLEEQRKVA